MRLNTGRTPSFEPMRPHLRLGHAAGHRLDGIVDDARARPRLIPAKCADRSASCARRASEKPIAFSRRMPRGVARQAVGAHLLLGADDLLDALQEPGIEAGDLR